MDIFQRILHKNGFYNELYDTVAGGYTPVSSQMKSWQKCAACACGMVFIRCFQ